MGTGSILDENPKEFFWDNTIERLGLEAKMPATRLEVLDAVTIGGGGSARGIPTDNAALDTKLNGSSKLELIVKMPDGQQTVFATET